MTRPSKFAPDFKARATDLYRTSEGRTITAPYTSTGSPAPVCVDVAGRPSHSHQSVQRLEERNRLPLKSEPRHSLQDLPWGRYPVTAPDKAESAPQRLRHGYRRETFPMRSPENSAKALEQCDRCIEIELALNPVSASVGSG